MLCNIKNYKFDHNYLIKILFNIFPLIMLMPSAYITLHLAIFIIYTYIFLFINKIKIKIFFIDYLVFIFFISSIISTIIGYGKSDYIIIAKSFADIRFALLFLLIRNLFYYKIIKINTLLRLSLLCVIFLSLDIFLQFFFGRDILGYPEIDGRYGGIFGEEAIAGSYIQKLSILAILATFYFKFKKFIKKELIMIFIITVFGIGILLTLDRMPFFIYIISIFSLLIFIKNFRKVFLFSFILIIILSFLFYKNNDRIEGRYHKIIVLAQIILFEATSVKTHQFINKNEVGLKEKTMQTGIEYFFLFDSALYTFKNNFWLGSGRKSYNKSCTEMKKYRGDLLCAPHTHNIYLETLINQGIIGMIIFLTFLITLLKKNYSDLVIAKISDSNKMLKISLLILFILEILPFRSYGYIFQSVNGTFFWFLMSLISSKLFINKNIK